MAFGASTACRHASYPAAVVTASGDEIGHAGARQVSLPFERSWATTIPLVSLNVGNEPQRLIIDTGASTSALLANSDTGLAEAPAPRASFRSMHGAGLEGTHISLPVGIAPGIEGAATSEFAILPPSSALPAGADGLLGVPFLRGHEAVLEMGSGRLHLIVQEDPASGPRPRRSQFPEPWRPDGGSEWVRLAMVPIAGGELYGVVCEQGGKELRWIIDTGASTTVLSDSSARALGLASHRRNSSLTDVSGGTTPLRYAVLPETQWGGRRISRVPVAIAKVPWEPDQEDAIDGLLGVDFLRRWNAIVDLHSQTLWLRLP